MCRKTSPVSKHRVAGFGLPLALFILIILGLLAAALYRVNATSVLQSAQEVITARALLAAESGAQSMMMRIFPTSGATNCTAQNITFSTSGLNNCTAAMTCSITTVNAINYYNIQSTGRCAVGTISAQRTLAVQARNL